MNSPFAIGIIGYRGFGAFCTEAFAASGRGRVVAYAGRDKTAMTETAQKHGVPKTYTDWRELTADPDIEIVHICTPPNLHAVMAIDALRHGKHVFVEKPLATTMKDAQAILDAGRTAKKRVGINFVMRYNPLYQLTEAITQSGAMGKLTHITFANYASDEGLDDTHWFWNKAQSGGIFVEHGVHFFDVLGHIVNAPAQIVTGKTWTRADGKEDRVQAVVTYENGVEATFYHAFNRPGALEQQTAHLAFERGHLMLHGWIPRRLALDALVSDANLDALRQILPVTDAPFDGPVRGAGQTYAVRHRVSAYLDDGDPTEIYAKAVADTFSDFADAVQNPAHTPRVTGDDGARSLQIALAARRAAETGWEQTP